MILRLLARPFIVLIILWALIHSIYHVLKPSRSHSFLPSTSASGTRRRRGLWNSSSTQVMLKNVHLRVQTTAWNLRHDIFTAALKRNGKATRALTRFYDLGFLLGVLGMLAGLGALFWTLGQTLYVLAQKAVANSPQSSELVKRTITSHLRERNLPEEHRSFIKPIIPGVTVPLGHLPHILSAIFVAQIFHELGHAIAAALDFLPILSAGAAFTLIIPSAFVTFSASAIEALPPRARARIISAGPFHNLFLWTILILMQGLGAGDVFWSVGYRNVSNVGRVVISVDVGSPLYAHLPPGSMITMLDDTPLVSTEASRDTWSSYLTGSAPDQQESLGWCTERVLEKPEQCCNIKPTNGLTCFFSGDSKLRGCLDPIPILTASGRGSRCNSDSNCTGNSTCVRPDGTDKFLRLFVHQPWSNGVSEVVLWNGPFEEVREEVHVGNLLPKFSIVPIWLPSQTQLFWQYLLMGTMSLFFFNLLPISPLDGFQFLQTILQIVFGGGRTDTLIYDVEALEAAQDRQDSRWRRRWRERLSELIPRITIGSCALCVLLGIINVLW